MTADPKLFSIAPGALARLELVGGQLPVLLIDDFYADPDAIRAMALQLPFRPPPYPYPGQLAEFREANPSFQATLATVRTLVNREYLARLPMAQNGQPIPAFGRLYSDFARTDLHPEELAPVQRIPHVDLVPVSGLVYLNRAERGGTLFFRQVAEVSEEDAASGYLTESNNAFELIGGIEGRFNRLAIYPGFVRHSEEIRGDWIRRDDRFTEPRLTQRLVFLP